MNLKLGQLHLHHNVAKNPQNQGLTTRLNKYTIDTWLGRKVVKKLFCSKLQIGVDNRTK